MGDGAEDALRGLERRAWAYGPPRGFDFAAELRVASRSAPRAIRLTRGSAELLGGLTGQNVYWVTGKLNQVYVESMTENYQDTCARLMMGSSDLLIECRMQWALKGIADAEWLDEDRRTEIRESWLMPGIDRAKDDPQAWVRSSPLYRRLSGKDGRIVPMPLMPWDRRE